jgi:hypothetical protein
MKGKLSCEPDCIVEDAHLLCSLVEYVYCSYSRYQYVMH